jgi:hypothetical protein
VYYLLLLLDACTYGSVDACLYTDVYPSYCHTELHIGRMEDQHRQRQRHTDGRSSWLQVTTLNRDGMSRVSRESMGMGMGLGVSLGMGISSFSFVCSAAPAEAPAVINGGKLWREGKARGYG